MNQPKGQIIQKHAGDWPMYVIPSGTKVLVANAFMTLVEHTTKNENLLWGDSIMSAMGSTFTMDALDVALSLEDLHKQGYIMFKTTNEAWPYMAVPRSVFKPEAEFSADDTYAAEVIRIAEATKKTVTPLTPEQIIMLQRRGSLPTPKRVRGIDYDLPKGHTSKSDDCGALQFDDDPTIGPDGCRREGSR